MKLGSRNEINTAITPVKFKKDNEHRLLATFDAEDLLSLILIH